MALQSSGAISASNINTELSKNSTAQMSLNATDIRTLAGKPSGAISFSNFYGKSAGISYVPSDITSISVVSKGGGIIKGAQIGRVFTEVGVAGWAQQ